MPANQPMSLAKPGDWVIVVYKNTSEKIPNEDGIIYWHYDAYVLFVVGSFATKKETCESYELVKEKCKDDYDLRACLTQIRKPLKHHNKNSLSFYVNVFRTETSVLKDQVFVVGPCDIDACNGFNERLKDPQAPETWD